jgi:hypothetical protein
VPPTPTSWGLPYAPMHHVHVQGRLTTHVCQPAAMTVRQQATTCDDARGPPRPQYCPEVQGVEAKAPALHRNVQCYVDTHVQPPSCGSGAPCHQCEQGAHSTPWGPLHAPCAGLDDSVRTPPTNASAIGPPVPPPVVTDAAQQLQQQREMPRRMRVPIGGDNSDDRHKSVPGNDGRKSVPLPPPGSQGCYPHTL